jgi:hypothetical protein
VDEYRIRNLLLVIDWLLKLKVQLLNNFVLLTICIVEQDANEKVKPMLDLTKVDYIFICNPSWYNRGRAFNVGTKQFIDYDYFFYADNDIILSEKDSLNLFQECFNYEAINPYKIVIDTKDCVTTNNVENFYQEGYKHGQDYLDSPRNGTCFSGGICGLSRKVIIQISGWDERFHGRGYEDYAFSSKLRLFVSDIYTTEYVAIHIWHPFESNSTREFNEILDKEYEEYDCDDYIQLILRDRYLFDSLLIVVDFDKSVSKARDMYEKLIEKYKTRRDVYRFLSDRIDLIDFDGDSCGNR